MYAPENLGKHSRKNDSAVDVRANVASATGNYRQFISQIARHLRQPRLQAEKGGHARRRIHMSQRGKSRNTAIEGSA
jgi:hypothetical protein